MRKRIILVMMLCGMLFNGCAKNTNTNVPTPTNVQVDESDTGTYRTEDSLLEKYQRNNLNSTIIIENIITEASKDISIGVYIVHNPGILGARGRIFYDNEVMELTSLEKGDAVGDVLNLTTSTVLEDGCSFLFDGLSIEPEQLKDGVMLILQFRVKDGTKAGRYPISLLFDEDSIIDNDLQPIIIDAQMGYVTVK